MCSIPGLPTPGSELSVVIRRVNLNPSYGLVELWVKMDDERRHIYEQVREKIQIPKRRFYRSEGKPGDLCLVCISDTWHRARIASIQSETYNIFLIDQGQLHVATSEALAWGQSDNFVLPPETESCILANVLSLENNWPERATNFFKSLPGKKFKALVQYVLMPDRTILLDIPIVSRNMCKFGVAKKILVDEFKSLVLKFLHLRKVESSEAFHLTQEQNLNVGYQLPKHDKYLYPELLTDTFETVNVTEVTDPLNIFCKLLILSKAVKILSEQIHQHYEESSDFGEAQPQTCGDPCASRGTNGRWRRSLLKQNIVTSDGAVEVLHVDEGETELVGVEDIRPLHGKFLRLPVVTYLCSLSGIRENSREWTTDETDYLKSLLLNQRVVARFDHHKIPQEVYYVTLYAANGACINSCFREKTGIIPTTKPEQDLSVQNELSRSSFFTLPGGEQCTDLQNKVNINVNGLQANGSTKDGSTSGTDDIHIKANYVDPLTHTNGHLSTGFPSDVQNACDDTVFTVGSSVNVKVSCIESLQKFWCQATENGDSLTSLMQDLQSHYASAQPQPLVESICVARNPDNNMWYRARIIARDHSPIVDVRFIDYGQTRKVPLQNVCPIDPAFLLLNAQAFQCCLFSLKDPTIPATVTCTNAALTEFQRFVDLGASSDTGLKCVIKAAISDEDGLLLNMVDIETASDSACKSLAQKCAQSEPHVEIPPQVSSDTYNYSTHNIEVGGKEKVWITFPETINHFYCQLDKNSHLVNKVMENVAQLLGQPQCSDQPLGLNSACFARYTDNQWYRGKVVEISPKPKVHFVDYGDTLAVNETDIRPIPPESSIARSVAVQAVPLGLFDVPAEVPQEVNQWFADCAINNSFTISVIAKGERGKLIVELFYGSININVKVRERIAKMKLHKMTGVIQQTDQQLYSSIKQATVPNEDCLTQECMKASVLTKMTVHNSNRMGASDELMSSKSPTDVSAPETGRRMILDDGRRPTLDMAETSIQHPHNDSEMAQPFLPSCPEDSVKICMYKKPNISQNKSGEVYASCIVEPHYFWCQYTNTDDLNMVSKLAQEAGQAPQDVIITQTIEPGSPCLALFSSDNQWCRAQVNQKADDTLLVMFVDYGNECEVNIRNVRSLPQSLLEIAPQAFLCRLNGFDESQGSWDDQVYDVFYNLLVDKLLKLTVFSMEDHSEIAIPQYSVEIECEGVIVNAAMQKYWKPVTKECVETESPQRENLVHDDQIESNITNDCASDSNMSACMFKEPRIFKNNSEMVYASVIVEPDFFWCQYADTEELCRVSQLAQEAVQAQQDMMFPETLAPGSPCLVLYSTDNQWYRAQVIRRVDDAFCVLFIDYGNESEVNIRNVRSLPQSLLEIAPQAFLCRLNGFDESQGSWDDQVYDDFYNLLVDKLLKLTVFSMEDHSAVPQYTVEIEFEGVIVSAAMQKYWKPVTKECVETESPQRENLVQDDQTESNISNDCASDACIFRAPRISKNNSDMVYASVIVEPHFFWCQYADTEELCKVSQLAQEAVQAQQDMMFPETLAPGSPCLALYSTDNQWYRAQVIRRVDDAFCVLFIDYGNESEVNIRNVRSLPRSLLEIAPQAFLCRLNGFDESRGSWDDQVYDDFYNLLVDKLLKLTVFSMEDHSAVPQYTVEIECEGVVVNTLMEKYWRGLDTNGALAESLELAHEAETGTTDASIGV